MSASSKSFPLPVQLVFRKNFMLKHCFGAVFFRFNLTKSGRHDQPQSGTFLEGVRERTLGTGKQNGMPVHQNILTAIPPSILTGSPYANSIGSPYANSTHLRSLLKRGTVLPNKTI